MIPREILKKIRQIEIRANLGIILCFALFLSGGLLGCATAPSTKMADARSQMLAAAEKGDPDFPDGRNLVLTHFSHVGQLATSQGRIVYVADRHSITVNALSPHGQKFISFFDDKFLFLGKIGYGKSSPLWCEGSKLYLSMHPKFILCIAMRK